MREHDEEDLRLGDELLPRAALAAPGAFAVELEFSSADLERWLGGRRSDLARASAVKVEPGLPVQARRASGALPPAQLSLFDLSQRQD